MLRSGGPASRFLSRDEVPGIIMSDQSVLALMGNHSSDPRMVEQRFDPGDLPRESPFGMLAVNMLALADLKLVQATYKMKMSSPLCHSLLNVGRRHLGKIDVEIESAKRCAGG